MLIMYLNAARMALPLSSGSRRYMSKIVVALVRVNLTYDAIQRAKNTLQKTNFYTTLI